MAALTTLTAIALFKGFTAVDEPAKFYLPIVVFNEGASIGGCVALRARGIDVDRYVVGRAYRVEYTREDRSIVRVIGEVDPGGALVQ